MKTIFALLFVLIFGLSNAQDRWFTTYSDSIRLVSDAEKIVEKFSNETKKVIPEFPKKVLVQKDTKPYLIFINDKGVHLPLWQEVIPEQKEFFKQMAGNENDGKKLFGLLFNGFYLVHELGHKVAEVQKIKFDNEYISEYYANKIAISWWRKNGNKKELKEAYDMIILLLPKLKNPVPKGQTIEQYFTENYEKVASDPYIYGYMQFHQFKEIYENNSLPKFETLLKQSN